MTRVTAALLLLTIVGRSAPADARPHRPRATLRAERWSVVAVGGVEALPDSAGAGLDALALAGLAGTVRTSPWTCLDVRFGLGATDAGSDTTRVSETRLRLDVRWAYCRALHRFFTLVLGAGPAAALSLQEARVREQRVRYSAFDLGASADAGGLLRLGPIVLRVDAEVGLLGRLVLGAFVGVGVAL